MRGAGSQSQPPDEVGIDDAAGKPASLMLNVHQKKLAVMARCGAIVPDKTHALKFDYLSIMTVSNHLRGFCVDAGLDIESSIENGELQLSIINVDDPSDRSVTHWPIVANDKGFAYTVKFPLVRLFLIGDGDENDEADMANQPAQQRRPKPAKPTSVARAVDEIDRTFGPASSEGVPMGTPASPQGAQDQTLPPKTELMPAPPDKRPGAFSHTATGHPERAQAVGRASDKRYPWGEQAEASTQRLYELAATLPQTPQTPEQVDALVTAHGFGHIVKRLTSAHRLQCGGDKCPHLTAALEGVLG